MLRTFHSTSLVKPVAAVRQMNAKVPREQIFVATKLSSTGLDEVGLEGRCVERGEHSNPTIPSSPAITGDVLWDLVKGVEALASWPCRTLSFDSIAPFEKDLNAGSVCQG